MKNLTWQQWVGIGLLVAFIIAAVVLHLVQPQVSYAYFEMCAVGTFVLGLITGYLLKKKNIVNEGTKQLLKD